MPLSKDNAQEAFLRTMYEKVNSVLGNDNQLFMMEFPGRSLNPADFEYSTVDRTSIITKPYSVMEREFRLTDDLFNVARITGGPTGEKLSTVFDIIINNYVPKLADYVDFAKDKTLLRHWLMEPKEFTRKDGTIITTSRIAFCEELMNDYLKKKLAWEQEKDTKFKEARAKGKKTITTTNAQNKTVEETVEDPDLMLIAMDDYSRWLGAVGISKDEELNQAYNDVVVRGHLHEVMTFLGFLNASTTAEALESTKQFMRNSSRLSVDSSSKIYPVTLSPTNWFKALRPNFAPKDLTMAKEALAAQYQNKSKALADIKAQKAELELINVNPKDITDAEATAKTLDDAARKLEADYIKAQTEGVVSAAKMAIKAMKAAGEALAASTSGGTLALSPLFARTFKSLSPTVPVIKDNTGVDKKENDVLVEIQNKVIDISNKLDEAVVARQKVTDLKAKIAMMKSNDFKSMLQKLDSKIGILTADLEYLRPLVSGAISISELEFNAAKAGNWNSSNLAKDKWVEETMFKQHSDKLLASYNRGQKATPQVDNGITGTLDSTGKKFTAAPTLVVDKLELDIKNLYNKLDAEYEANKKREGYGVAEKSLMPDSDLDISDLSFSDIIITDSDTSDASSAVSTAQATQSSEKTNAWFYSRQRNSSQSSASSSFQSTALSSKFECGFRVAKVTIDRGGWFNPTLLKMSKSFYRLADMNGGSGLTMDDMEDEKYADAKKQAQNCLLPAYPVAFVIAKDITFKIENSATVSSAFKSNAESSSSSGSSFGGFAASSSSSSSSSTASSAYSGTHGDSLYVRIPGPQIIGWYLQFTPKDESVRYVKQSDDQGKGAVDILTLDDEAILLELRLRREQLEDKVRNEGNPFA